MKATLSIDEDVLRAAEEIARSEGRTTDEVVSELARTGLETRKVSDEVIPTFPVSEDARPITLEMVKRALDED